MFRKATFVFVTFLAFSTSCKQQPGSIEIKKTEISIDSIYFQSYADTIVNDMVIKNPDPTDAWMESCLKDLKRKEFIEDIFSDLYNQKLLAFDYYSGKQLTIKELKNIEKTENYSRDIIGKFQFREAWFYDKENHAFVKKVHSIIFGYETYDETGFVKGYKPLFMVKF